MNNVPLEITNRYTGPGFKHVAIAALAIVPLVFILATSNENSAQRDQQLRRQKESSRQVVAEQPLDWNRKDGLMQGSDLIKTVDARVKVIDRQLQSLREPTGRPEDVDRRNALLAERKSLTRE